MNGNSVHVDQILAPCLSISLFFAYTKKEKKTEHVANKFITTFPNTNKITLILIYQALNGF